MIIEAKECSSFLPVYDVVEVTMQEALVLLSQRKKDGEETTITRALSSLGAHAMPANAGSFHD
jgi:topoisomerase IA-like protein